MSEKILSICIPTYNRADILDKTLSKLVLEPAFQSGQIEICISDNASPDHTMVIVKKYISKYDNIVYIRNNENTVIIDGNFPIVASLATGTFIKFLNDYAYFIPGELNKMIEFIESNKKEKPVLFFSNNNLPDKTEEIVYCNSFDSFVKTASYWTTWVLAAGFWREDFISIKDRDRSISKFMWCPDNYLRLMSMGRRAIVYNRKFCSLTALNNKGGYNVFYIFGVNYLSLYDEYLGSKLMTHKTFNIERHRLFKYFLMGWYQTLVISKNKNYIFEKNDAIKILKKNYQYTYYFYFGIISLHLQNILKILQLKKINKNI